MTSTTPEQTPKHGYPNAYVDAIALATYGVHREAQTVHPGMVEWQMPGIRSAVGAMLAERDYATTLIAFATGARDPQIRTPKGIQPPEPEWVVAKRKAERMHPRCVEHPEHLAGNCRECARMPPVCRPSNFAEIVREYEQRERERRLAEAERSRRGPWAEDDDDTADAPTT